VSRSFPSVFPLLSGGTMTTCEGCCHLTGAMLNLAAEAADRARILLLIYKALRFQILTPLSPKKRGPLPFRPRPYKVKQELNSSVTSCNTVRQGGGQSLSQFFVHPWHQLVTFWTSCSIMIPIVSFLNSAVAFWLICSIMITIMSQQQHGTRYLK
jgi:hypothetical protein